MNTAGTGRKFQYLMQSSGGQNSLGFEWYPGNRNSLYQEDTVTIQTEHKHRKPRGNRTDRIRAINPAPAEITP